MGLCTHHQNVFLLNQRSNVGLFIGLGGKKFWFWITWSPFKRINQIPILLWIHLNYGHIHQFLLGHLLVTKLCTWPMNLELGNEVCPQRNISNKEKFHQLILVLFPCFELGLHHHLLKTPLSPRTINLLFVNFSCHALCIKNLMLQTKKMPHKQHVSINGMETNNLKDYIM